MQLRQMGPRVGATAATTAGSRRNQQKRLTAQNMGPAAPGMRCLKRKGNESRDRQGVYRRRRLKNRLPKVSTRGGGPPKGCRWAPRNVEIQFNLSHSCLVPQGRIGWPGPPAAAHRRQPSASVRLVRSLGHRVHQPSFLLPVGPVVDSPAALLQPSSVALEVGQASREAGAGAVGAAHLAPAPADLARETRGV